jgi:hypothetical protein
VRSFGSATLMRHRTLYVKGKDTKCMDARRHEQTPGCFIIELIPANCSAEAELIGMSTGLI